MRWTRYLSRLPEIDRKAYESDKKAESLAAQYEQALSQINEELDQLRMVQSNYDRQIEILGKSFQSPVNQPSKDSPEHPDPSSDLFADNHLMDVFYAAFEDHFRGSEDEIYNRLKEHLPLFKDSSVNFKKSPVLDIGSGRGEFLRLLSDNNISAIGIDINLEMVERSKKNGLNVIQGDAVAHLEGSEPGEYGAISGFHLIEHLPFPLLMRLFKASQQALAKNGFVLFETPNPENLIVGSCNFYHDPSHLNPLPPALIEFALKSCNFKKVETIRLHPLKPREKSTKHSQLPKDLYDRIYGPSDYAVIGFK